MIRNITTKHDGFYKCVVKSNYSDQVHEDTKVARLYVKGLYSILKDTVLATIYLKQISGKRRREQVSHES